jgi:hypothetical protein
MKKHLFISILFFSFLGKTAAQDGIIAIARYDTSGPMKMRFDDPLLEFSGGFEAFQNLFLKEFKMPVKALRATKAPDGMVGFTVNIIGKIVKIEVIDPVSDEIDAEVVRVLTEISDFHLQSLPQKFAIQYNVFPDWFRDYINEQEEDARIKLQAARTDSLLKSKKISDLEKAVDHRRAHPSGSICAGFTTMNDPLSKYLKSCFVLGFDLNFYKKNWFLGGNLQFRSTELKQDFEYLYVPWDKYTSVSLVSIGVASGYKVIDEERLTFTPFVGIGFGNLSLPSPADESLPEGGSIASFAPTLGFFADYKYRVRARNAFFDSKLVTSNIRLRLAVSPMNFKDGRRGNVVDLGIGLAFSQQSLKLE